MAKMMCSLDGYAKEKLMLSCRKQVPRQPLDDQRGPGGLEQSDYPKEELWWELKKKNLILDIVLESSYLTQYFRDVKLEVSAMKYI